MQFFMFYTCSPVFCCSFTRVPDNFSFLNKILFSGTLCDVPSSKQQSLPFPIIFLTLNVFHNAIVYPPGAEHQTASGWPRRLRLGRLLALQWQLEYIKAMRLNGLPKVIDTNYVLHTTYRSFKLTACCEAKALFFSTHIVYNFYRQKLYPVKP